MIENIPNFHDISWNYNLQLGISYQLLYTIAACFKGFNQNQVPKCVMNTSIYSTKDTYFLPLRIAYPARPFFFIVNGLAQLSFHFPTMSGIREDQ